VKFNRCYRRELWSLVAAIGAVLWSLVAAINVSCGVILVEESFEMWGDFLFLLEEGDSCFVGTEPASLISWCGCGSCRMTWVYWLNTNSYGQLQWNPSKTQRIHILFLSRCVLTRGNFWWVSKSVNLHYWLKTGNSRGVGLASRRWPQCRLRVTRQLDFDFLRCTRSTCPKSARINDLLLSATDHLLVVVVGQETERVSCRRCHRRGVWSLVIFFSASRVVSLGES